MKKTITIPIRDQGLIEVEATIIGPLAVHQEHEGQRWNVAHAATGCTFGVPSLADEETAIEAARLVLANETLAHVLEPDDGDECRRRQEAVGRWVFRGACTDAGEGATAARRADQQEAGEVPDIHEVIEYITDGKEEDIEPMEAVCEMISDATDEDKSLLFRSIMQDCGAKATSCAEGYSEPGYDEPAQPYVFLGDWWSRDGETLKESKLVSIIEAAGGAVEWHDEWTECGECNKAVRTSPDGYSWTRSYVLLNDCEVVCCQCMEDESLQSEYLTEDLEGNSDKADTLGIDLGAHGYVRMDVEFQNGLYGGQSASPHKIADALLERGIERFVFQIDRVRQFDMDFSCWVHEDEDLPALSGEETDGPDPARSMQAALQDATAKMADLPDGPGVKVAKCNPDGTASVRTVSPEDFIAGKALD